MGESPGCDLSTLESKTEAEEILLLTLEKTEGPSGKKKRQSLRVTQLEVLWSALCKFPCSYVWKVALL